MSRNSINGDKMIEYKNAGIRGKDAKEFLECYGNRIFNAVENSPSTVVALPQAGFRGLAAREYLLLRGLGDVKYVELVDNGKADFYSSDVKGRCIITIGNIEDMKMSDLKFAASDKGATHVEQFGTKADSEHHIIDIEEYDSIGTRQQSMREFADCVAPRVAEYLSGRPIVVVPIMSGAVWEGMSFAEAMRLLGVDANYAEVEKGQPKIYKGLTEGRICALVDDSIATGSAFRRVVGTLKPLQKSRNMPEFIYVVDEDKRGTGADVVDGVRIFSHSGLRGDDPVATPANSGLTGAVFGRYHLF